MRDSFIESLFSLASIDKNIVLMTGDLGFGVLDKFAKDLPRQFVNAGIAEQNMLGMASGMAMDGKVVFVYSIGNFPTFRAFEQFRNDASYHGANVKVVSVGAGYSYGSLGMSHHATEDLAVMRALPGVTIISPGCLWEARQSAKALLETNGTCYLRLDKSNAGETQKDEEKFQLGKLRIIREGTDGAIFATGGILGTALSVANVLASGSINLAVYSVHSIRPFDSEGLLKVVSSCDACFTIEEHVLTGGLGAIIAEHCMDAGVHPKYFHRFGISGGYSSIVGSQDYLRSASGLDSQSIVNRIKTILA